MPWVNRRTTPPFHPSTQPPAGRYRRGAGPSNLTYTRTDHGIRTRGRRTMDARRKRSCCHTCRNAHCHTPMRNDEMRLMVLLGNSRRECGQNFRMRSRSITQITEALCRRRRANIGERNTRTHAGYTRYQPTGMLRPNSTGQQKTHRHSTGK